MTLLFCDWGAVFGAWGARGGPSDAGVLSVVGTFGQVVPAFILQLGGGCPPAVFQVKKQAPECERASAQQEAAVVLGNRPQHFTWTC